MPASSNPADHALPDVPPTLLNGVLQRLQQRETFLITHSTTAELLDALQHPQWEIRAGAVRALGNLGDQAPFAALLIALHDEHRMVRLVAVHALSKQEGRVPLTQLAAALRDSDWEVREAAEQALQRIEHAVTKQHTHSPFAAVAVFLRHCWYVFTTQMKALDRSWWLGTTLAMLLSGMLALVSLLAMHSSIQNVSLLLALFTTISAATGSAFLYGPNHDESFELMLATPTSVRLIMLCRFVWVVGYNLVLAALISALVALLHGGGFWTIIQFWLYPMLLIAAFSLTLSLQLGSWLSILAGILLEASQALHFTSANYRYTPGLMFNTGMTWLNSPLALLLAALCLGIALFWLPRTTLSNAL